MKIWTSPRVVWGGDEVGREIMANLIPFACGGCGCCCPALKEYYCVAFSACGYPRNLLMQPGICGASPSATGLAPVCAGVTFLVYAVYNAHRYGEIFGVAGVSANELEPPYSDFTSEGWLCQWTILVCPPTFEYVEGFYFGVPFAVYQKTASSDSSDFDHLEGSYSLVYGPDWNSLADFFGLSSSEAEPTFWSGNDSAGSDLIDFGSTITVTGCPGSDPGDVSDCAGFCPDSDCAACSGCCNCYTITGSHPTFSDGNTVYDALTFYGAGVRQPTGPAGGDEFIPDDCNWGTIYRICNFWVLNFGEATFYASAGDGADCPPAGGWTWLSTGSPVSDDGSDYTITVACAPASDCNFSDTSEGQCIAIWQSEYDCATQAWTAPTLVQVTCLQLSSPTNQWIFLSSCVALYYQTISESEACPSDGCPQGIPSTIPSAPTVDAQTACCEEAAPSSDCANCEANCGSGTVSYTVSWSVSCLNGAGVPVSCGGNASGTIAYSGCSISANVGASTPCADDIESIASIGFSLSCVSGLWTGQTSISCNDQAGTGGSAGPNTVYVQCSDGSLASSFSIGGTDSNGNGFSVTVVLS